MAEGDVLQHQFPKNHRRHLLDVVSTVDAKDTKQNRDLQATIWVLQKSKAPMNKTARSTTIAEVVEEPANLSWCDLTQKGRTLLLGCGEDLENPKRSRRADWEDSRCCTQCSNVSSVCLSAELCKNFSKPRIIFTLHK